MQHFPQIQKFLLRSACGVLIGTQLISTNPSLAGVKAQHKTICQSTQQKPNFLVFGGGGAPGYNEIALEKNVLYFQRTLTALGYNPSAASIFFANGNNGQATVRYIDDKGSQQFKVPQIPNLNGAATLSNLQSWMQQTARQTPGKPLFFYFTGHGIPNQEDINNNALILWNEQPLSVRQFSGMLDKLPSQTSVVTMMSQCFSGSFANFIYQDGNPNRPLALQTRCGFFATIKTKPSVGCTPAVNEADYRDYSSSFFAGLSGRSRTGQMVASADYNKDGTVSYAEAHAFAKVDEQTTDLPISTSEAWLQSQASQKGVEAILGKPIANITQTARPEQKYTVDRLSKAFKFNRQKSFTQNVSALSQSQVNTEEKQAYLRRLGMELVNIDMEKQIRTSANQQKIAIIDRLVKCEASSFNKQ